YAYGGAESSYRTDEFGEFREDYRFTGKEDDVEVGLIYFGFRYYAPLLGRWISADPLAVHSPGAADLNLFAYVHGQALVAVDPVGLFFYKPYYKEKAEPRAYDRYTDGIRPNAVTTSAYLPTTVVRTVANPDFGIYFAKHDASSSDPSQYIHKDRVMKLTHEAAVGLEHMATRSLTDFGEDTRNGINAIGTLIHESVHAYLWVNSERDMRIESMWERGARYYMGAQLTEGEKVTTDRWARHVFNEACAGYAGHVTRTFLTASLDLDQTLVEVQAGRMSLADAKSRVAEIKAKFNTEIQNDVFGYWPLGENTYARVVDRRLPRFAKRFVHGLLDNQIGATFDSTPRLKAQEAAIETAGAEAARKQDNEKNKK
ncbi:MAG: RHS repeat-associated core domain-containing protein, partial [Polyangiaceae bacterium]|nr:RHS repeat-associated core domain-containing protein [Polyangiaceae bacterium]